jgi:hypothetical protein
MEYFEKISGKTGLEFIIDKNEAYLDASFEKSLKGFLILSGIKSALAVIEGSEVGIGFNIQVGDVVQSVYDYVDIAWKASLAGGTILIIARLVIQAVSIVNHYFMAFFFLSFFCYQLCLFTEKKEGLKHFFKIISWGSGLTTIVLYIIFPVTISCSAFFSTRITNPMIEESRKGYEKFSHQLSAEKLSEKLFSSTQNNSSSVFDKLNFKNQFEQAKKNLQELSNFLQKITQEIAVWTIKLIAGYLFDCMIFPAIFFTFLYGTLKITFRLFPEAIIPLQYKQISA